MPQKPFYNGQVLFHQSTVLFLCSFPWAREEAKVTVGN